MSKPVLRSPLLPFAEMLIHALPQLRLERFASLLQLLSVLCLALHPFLGHVLEDAVGPHSKLLEEFAVGQAGHKNLVNEVSDHALEERHHCLFVQDLVLEESTICSVSKRLTGAFPEAKSCRATSSK